MNSKEFAKRISDLSVLRRIPFDHSVKEALFVFTISRVIIFAIAVIVGQVAVNTEGKHFYQDILDPVISFDKAPVGRKLRQAMARGDASWYCAVAEDGYEHQPFEVAQHKWAFFPLYPLTLRLAATITGEYLVTGAVLSNLFFFLAIVLLHKLVGEWGYDTLVADRSIFYLAIYPTSYFFSLSFTESLFLLLTVASFLAARRERWWWASVLGALASATRSGGVLLLPALAVYNLMRYRSWRPRKLLPLLLIPLGLVAFMVYLKIITGNAWAFREVQAAWGRQSGFFLTPLLEYLKKPADVAFPWNPMLLNFAAALMAFGCAYYLMKRREWALGLYTLLSVIVPLSSLSLQSLARYMSVVFPIFIVLALWGKSPRVDQTIRVVFIVLFALMTALWAAHVSLALS
ncbi:MAG: hypothetical protein M3539_07705 [Acidobacteriota bacterium]|nr:hypothetical protein [Acidobacteriota bacterium]